VLVDAESGHRSEVPAWFAKENGYQDDGLPGELYDLEDDLPQRRNRFAEQSGKVAELREMLQRIRKSGQVRPVVVAP